MNSIKKLNMEIKVTQCSIGRHNLLSNEKSLSFYMGIYNNNNEIIEENGVKALLHYSGEPEEIYIFEDALNNIEEVFSKCLDYSNKIWSSTNYKAQCLLFYKTYQTNFDTLDTNMKAIRDEEIKKEIERLQKRLAYRVLDDLEDAMKSFIDNQIKSITKSIEYLNKVNSELKEDSETFSKNKEKIFRHKEEIENYQKILI
jgi:hypothetical protein